MRQSSILLVSTLSAAAIAAPLAAQVSRPTDPRPDGRSHRVVTDATGTYLIPTTGPARRPSPLLGGGDAILWTYPHPTSIPESCALSTATGHAWVGQSLNQERLQRFAITGGGTPQFEFPGTHATFNPSAAAAAKGADLAVYLDQLAQGGQLVISAFNSTSTSTPLWTFALPANYNYAGARNIKVSRNGAVVACIADDRVENSGVCYFLDGATGNVINRWLSGPGAGTCTGVDITDDGSKALLCHITTARLINTATGVEEYSVVGSGAGGRYNISGDGNVLVVGGFSLQVYKKIAGVYTQRINFTAPTSWFSWASAVSRDGSTVGVLAHNYGASYLNTDTRIWDVNTGQLLGTHSTVGSGGFQDSAWGASLSDNGDRLAVCSWGAEDNNHPEVMVFDRAAHMIGSIDTSGSPFSLDMSGNGRYVLAGNKSVHANTFGNGGMVTLLEIPVAGCYPNCDGSSTAPVLNVSDFICFQTKYAAGDPYANCDGSTTPPVLNVADFICFQTAYAAGCP